MAQRLDHAALLNRAASFVAQGRPLAARPLLATLRRACVEPVAVTALAAQIEVAEGRVDAAVETITAAIDAAPAEAGLYTLRADLLARAGRTAAALQDAAEAVVRMPRDIAARGALGLLLLESGRREEAITVLDDVLADAPDRQGITLALALAHEVGGDFAAASGVLERAAARVPSQAWPFAAAMLMHLRNDQPERAIAAGEAARSAGVADGELLGLLGHAHGLCGDHVTAAEIIGDARAGKPLDADLRHLATMAALAGPPPGDRWPVAYVRAVFDAFAARFDARLTGLHYQAPARMRELVAAYASLSDEGRLGPVLDLGCGTGLLAAALSDLPAGPFEGVDLSPAMIAEAACTNLYDKLTEADIAAYLPTAAPQFALACAADVFCYLGDLAPFVAGIARTLRPGGLAVFTAEAMTAAEAAGTEQGWVRRRSGRYAHSERYLRETAAAAGLTILSLTQEGLRDEYGRTLPAHYVAARRTLS